MRSTLADPIGPADGEGNVRLALAGRGSFRAERAPRAAAPAFGVKRMPAARWRHLPLALSFLVALLGAMTALASRDEYQVKAAFLLNFAKLVKWPARAQPAPGDPIVLGVKGGASVVESQVKGNTRGAAVAGGPSSATVAARRACPVER